MGERRKSRELALQVLFGLDMSTSSVDEALTFFWAVNPGEADTVKSFTEELVRGAHEKKEEIDSIISTYSANWKLPRMSVVDRNILRLAIYELQWCRDIPVRVTLNEAIEIAKTYGTEESSAFVNGILDKVAKNINKE